MKTQDFKKVIEGILKEASTDVISELFQSEISPDRDNYDNEDTTAFKSALSDAGIEFAQVDNYGGEDQGSEYWSVYSFSKETELQWVKFNGYYASYSGSEFDRWFFVKPVPKSGFDFVELYE